MYGTGEITAKETDDEGEACLHAICGAGPLPADLLWQR